ncbi:hypothetical protein A9Q99_16780 [Gammaproteobacteria bacterium 45_16_T64]|nr:hypothetical protein A9Q99_16780 [Gammaproteobacteria bacterium 45_16_T64]
MLKQFIHQHHVVAKHSRAEIRHPWARVCLALGLSVSGVYVLYRIVIAVWIRSPIQDGQFDIYGLGLLSPLMLSGLYLIYMAGLLLFASPRRSRKGFLGPIGLRVSGVLIVAVGVFGLLRGNIYAAFVVAVGAACFGLARDRKDFISRDREWV